MMLNPNKMEYLYNRRMAIIQKAHTPLQMKIQMIFNRAVDEKILRYYDDYEYIDNYNVPYYKEEVLFSAISDLNKIATLNDFKRLMKYSIVKQNHITNLEMYNSSQRISNKITLAELERIDKNMRYINQTLKEADYNIGIYKKLIKELPQTVSRKEILERALETGRNYKGRKYSYKELRNISKDLEKYKDNALRYEKAKIENNQSEREGLGKINKKKIWKWSRLERTRHSRMENKEVGIDELFTVENEVSGDVDFLRFPQDIENDRNNCSNICNCGCYLLIK